MSSCYKRLFRWTLVSFSFFLPCLPRNITGIIKIWQPPPLKEFFPQQALLHRTFTSGFTPMSMLSLEYLRGLKWDGFGRNFVNSLFNPIQTAPSLINWITFNKTVQVRLPNLAKFIWEHFKVIVTCTSTLMLSWLPIFCGHFFFWKTCLFFKKKFLFLFLLSFLPTPDQTAFLNIDVGFMFENRFWLGVDRKIKIYYLVLKTINIKTLNNFLDVLKQCRNSTDLI